jgi:hypothetical protein
MWIKDISFSYIENINFYYRLSAINITHKIDYSLVINSIIFYTQKSHIKLITICLRPSNRLHLHIDSWC